ncbi:MAG: Phosphoglycerate kinase [Parcubacteria group bacterium Gr01-1014_73]|nr:MAG: Phosphoglycerate kinase [Parcubacteria group bacterium Gr01-1014_73]
MDLPLLENQKNLAGKRVLLRLDLNVPIKDGKVVDDFRIRKILPTLELLHNAGARTIILSHLEGKGGDSLRPVWQELRKRFLMSFSANFSELAKNVADLEDGGFTFFENLRVNAGEKANDENFARELASFGEIFVNEAFAVSHRAHASIVGLPRLLPSFAGLLFAEETRRLSAALKPPRPALFILGGAKFETKLPLLKKFIGLYDLVFVGGALANDFLKAQGFDVGNSLISKTPPDLNSLIKSNLHLPVDTITAERKKIVDAGPKTLEILRKLISKAQFILWNGPLGEYEVGFDTGTKNLAAMIAQSQAKSVVGGGDTVAAITALGLEDKFSFVSTGGGAMLDFLANETLPGLQSLLINKELRFFGPSAV